MPVASSVAAKSAEPGSSGFGRWLLVLAAGLVVVCALGYRVLSRNRTQPSDAPLVADQSPAAPLVAASGEPAAVTAESAATSPASSAAAAESATAAPSAELAASATPEPSAAAEPSSAAPEPSAAAEPGAAAAATVAPEASAAGEIRKVTVKSRPPKVRFFHFGKQVGVTPFVLELKPGERHAYEAGLPGYGTRRVVIDGSKPEIIIGLKRETP